MAGLKMADEENITETTKTQAEKMLDTIDDAIEKLISGGFKSIKINNREYTNHSIDELRRLRDYYRGEIARQKVRKTGKFKSYRYRF